MRHWMAPRHSAHARHARMIRRQLQVTHIHKLDIKDQISLGRNSWMRRVRPRTAACAIRQFPRNKEASLSSDLHADKPLIESGNHAPKSLRNADGLRIAHLRLAALVNLRLTIGPNNRCAVIIRRIKLVPVSREPTGVLNLIELVRLSFHSGADFDVLITQRERSLHDAAHGRYTRRQLSAAR